MKVFSDEALDALEAGDVVVSGAVRIDCDPGPMFWWGGYGVLTIGEDDFTGIGDRGLVSASGGALGGSEQNVTLSLSGVEPEVVALLDVDILRRAPVILWRLLFDSSGSTLLDAQVYTRGRVDQVRIAETPGGTSTIEVLVEGAARGLGRSGGRMRTDADQRLVSADDAGFKSVSYAGEKTLNWGGKPSITASAGLPTAAPANAGDFLQG